MGEQLHERQTALKPFILMDRIGARPSRSAAALRGISPADDLRNMGPADEAVPRVPEADEVLLPRFTERE